MGSQISLAIVATSPAPGQLRTFERNLRVETTEYVFVRRVGSFRSDREDHWFRRRLGIFVFNILSPTRGRHHHCTRSIRSTHELPSTIPVVAKNEAKRIRCVAWRARETGPRFMCGPIRCCFIVSLVQEVSGRGLHSALNSTAKAVSYYEAEDAPTNYIEFPQ